MANFGIMGFPKKVLSANISGKHALAGAAAGTVGIGAVKWGLNTIKVGGVPLAAKIPVSLARFTPLITSVIAAFAGYTLLSKTQKKYANSFAIGALSSGVVLTVGDFLRSSFPAMGDLVTYRLPGMGYVVPSAAGHSISPRLNGLTNFGLLTPDTGNARLNGLAASAMGGMEELVEYNLD